MVRISTTSQVLTVSNSNSSKVPLQAEERTIIEVSSSTPPNVSLKHDNHVENTFENPNVPNQELEVGEPSREKGKVEDGEEVTSKRRHLFVEVGKLVESSSSKDSASEKSEENSGS